jgi:hypothetical protein
MNIDSGKRERKRRNFLYHQMSGAEYKWKVWRRNQICKFENVSFGFLGESKRFQHRTPRIHFIAARMWLPFSYSKSSSLYKRTLREFGKRKNDEGKFFNVKHFMKIVLFSRTFTDCFTLKRKTSLLKRQHANGMCLTSPGGFNRKTLFLAKILLKHC